MSEKRFEVINARWQGKGESVAFEDTRTNQVYFAENQEECERIVGLLNEQQSTISRLEEENEQLRQFINKGRRLSVKELMDNINENELLKKKIRGLEKENEQLKQEVFVYKKAFQEQVQRCSL